MLRWLTAGESHGQALVAVLEGLPAGVEVTTGDVADALARRRLGYGRGARMSFERDEVTFLGGVRHGSSIGSPLAVMIGNTEWPKWQTVMSADPVEAADLARANDVGAEKELARNRPLTRPRPGHADLVGMQKYGFDEARPVLERASARETAARVALGVTATDDDEVIATADRLSGDGLGADLLFESGEEVTEGSLTDMYERVASVDGGDRADVAGVHFVLEECAVDHLVLEAFVVECHDVQRLDDFGAVGTAE